MEKVTLIIGAVLLVSYFLFTETLDWIGRLDVIRGYFPRFPTFLERRSFRVVLLLVAIALLIRVVSLGGSNKPEVHEAPSLTSQPAPVQQPQASASDQTSKQQVEPQPESVSRDAAEQTRLKKIYPKTTPVATKPLESTTPFISQNNSGGINVQQATTGKDSPIIDSPITINTVPPLPGVTWKTDKLAPSDGKKPGVMIHISIDKGFPNAAFAALCDRPCTSVVAVIPMAGFTGSSGGFSKSNPSLVVIKLDLPSLVTPADTVNWEVRSNDGEDVAIVKVEAIRQ